MADYLPAILASAEPDTRLMCAFAAYAGLRCAEIANLDRDDLSLHTIPPVLAVRAGKGNKDRLVPIHPDLVTLIGKQRPGPLFDVCPKTVGRKIAEHLRGLGIDATAHQLRHTFGTELARAADGNVILVAKLMGHENVQTSMNYIGWAGGESASVVGRMFPDYPQRPDYNDNSPPGMAA